jgi:serine/threonine protein phosphatase PrpC
MPINDTEATTLFTDRDMSGGELVACATGIAAVFSASMPGRTSGNEDAAAVIALSAKLSVLAVADGMGGQPGGAQASKTALHALNNSVQRGVKDEIDLRDAILNGFERANETVMAMGIGAGTTLAVLEIHGDRIRPYHAGDSIILVVGRGGKTKLETVSHSPVGYGLEAGLLCEEEAIEHVDRHLVSNYVGTPDMRIEIGAELRLRPYDTVLIATDGLSDNLSMDKIVQLIRKGHLAHNTEQLAKKSGEAMRMPREGAPSKPDDLTFILYRRT